MNTTAKIKKWADLLLDTGKGNNLINCKDNGSSMAEIVLPSAEEVYAKVSAQSSMEIVFPKGVSPSTPREEYPAQYGSQIKKGNQILLYSSRLTAEEVVKKLSKKAASAIEETGVNVLYLAIGFVHWVDKADSEKTELKSPILLTPVTLRNDSSFSPYYLTAADEVIVNPTFAYKLQVEYNVKLPEYDEEAGLSSYITSVESLVSRLKWRVSRECKLGLFSFLKVNMYEDLKENAEVIARNPNILGLLKEKRPESNVTGDFEGDLNNVVDADYSQEQAIRMARSGRSFVLQGPPGTGKSQTITNVIAECINAGKKILFVSEKSAALNVVFDKLKKAGLDDFCLELHSHKANKKEVVANLVSTLKAPKSVVSKRAQQETEAKQHAKDALDGYAVELHRVRPVIDRSLYRLFEDYAACRMTTDVEFVIDKIGEKGAEYLERVETLLGQFVRHTEIVGKDYRTYPWYGYVANGGYSTKIRLQEDLKASLAHCLRLQGISDEARESFGLTFSSRHDAEIALKVIAAARSRDAFAPAMLRKGAAPLARQEFLLMKDAAKDVLSSKAYLQRRFEDKVFDLDGTALYETLTVRYRSLFKRLFSKEYKELRDSIQFLQETDKRLGYRALLKAMRHLKNYQERTRAFLESESKVGEYLGQGYKGVDSDFDRMIEVATILSETDALGFDAGEMSELSLASYDAAYDEILRTGDSIKRELEESASLVKRTSAYFDSQEFSLADTALMGVVDKFGGMLSLFGEIEAWCEFSKVMAEIKKLGIKEFVDDAIDKEINVDHFVPAFRKAFLHQWIDLILSDDPTFSQLPRIPHDEAVEIFRKKDVLQFEINKASIRAKLSALRPNLDMVAPGSATAILLREGEKKRKQKSIRALLTEARDVIQTIKPCFLMSPLSVSTYLTADTCFDVVVFDEASQIFPQDAIGAIYRGKQLIVVGDSKQMPPSNFFNTVIEESADEEDEELTDFESILDVCATFMPQLRLKWHYRSRNEQLIAFSNKAFYDNELITFPSPVRDGAGVGLEYRFVEGGVFDRRTRTNRVEAEAVADLVFEHVEKHPDASLGVVAFNIGQQELIDKLISARRQKDPSKDAFFRSDRPEPFFIKNLETVQGDERDFIIFSTTYAPDESGKFLLNFGPINRAGGERRLNVAATRAKIDVQLVSSIHYYDIDLARTGSTGVRIVREYLEFAEKGTLEMPTETKAALFESQESDLVKEVKEYLAESGFEADEQVGRSSSKIELAVKQLFGDNYALAIECDGVPYRAFKSTRDRDRLRPEVLERMGWRHHRLWSTDWFRSKAAEKKRLLDAVNAAMTGSPLPVGIKNGAKKSSEEKDEIFEEASKAKTFTFPVYETVDHWQVFIKRHSIWMVIKEIVMKESPVSEEWLLRRIVQLFGKDKVIPSVKEEFEKVMLGCESRGVERKGGFLYKKDAEIPMLRVPANENSVRDIKYVSLEELAKGLERIVQDNVSLDRAGLFGFLVRKMGFSRVGDAMVARLNEALDLVGDSVVEKGGRLVYVGD